MDIYKILGLLLYILCVIGLSKETTTPSQQECYTQPPGRSKDNYLMSCRDKYAVIPGQLFCQLNVQRKPLSMAEQNEIEGKHNEIRSQVYPKAANMLNLKYIEAVGRLAQIWAEMCQLNSSNPLQRFRPGSYVVGENIYVSNTNISWSDVIDIWAQENSSFTYGSSNNNRSQVSNYLQLIWAKTSVVGCSKSICGGKYFYVCNYAPAMDYDIVDQPYQSSNQSCSECSNCTNTLCNCVGVICLNGAELNYTTCKCNCIKEVNNYEEPTCELFCEPNGDDPECGKVFKKTTCQSNFTTLFHCPWMCNICPYAGKKYKDNSEPLPWERNRTECPPETTTSVSAKISPASNGLQAIQIMTQSPSSARTQSKMERSTPVTQSPKVTQTIRVMTQPPTSARTQSKRQGNTPVTQSPKVTQTSIQANAKQTTKNASLQGLPEGGKSTQTTTNPNEQKTKSTNQTSGSTQMKDKPCGNGASCSRVPHWDVVFVLILAMYATIK